MSEPLERAARLLAAALTETNEIATTTTDDFQAAAAAALRLSRGITDALRALGPALSESTKRELEARHGKSLSTLVETLRKENERG